MPTDPFQDFFRDPTRRSFRRLVRAEQTAVTSTAWRVLGDLGLAEDVAQELFMAVLQHTPDSARPERRAAWLSKALGLARTRLRSERRRSLRERRAAEEREEVQNSDQQGTLLEVREALADLPGDLRECTELRYFAGLSSDEIAEQLRVTRRAVDDRLSRARGKLELRLSAAGALTLASPPEVVGSAAAALQLAQLGTSLPVWSGFVKGMVLLGTFVSALSMVWIGSVLLRVESVSPVSEIAEVHPLSPTSSFDEAARTSAPADAKTLNSEEVREEGLMSAEGERKAIETSPASFETPKDPSQRSLVVHVVDAAGDPLPGATLRFEPEGLRTLSALHELEEVFEPWQSLLEPQAMDAKGTWTAEGLPAELVGLDFTLDAHAPRLGSAETLHFALGEETETVLTLTCPPPRTVHLSCVAADTDQGIEGARVRFVTEANRRNLDPSEITRVTGPDGRTQHRALGAGEQEVLVEAEGYQPLNATISGEATDAVLELVPTTEFQSLTVRVLDSSGQPVPQTPVKALLTGRKVMHELQTDANGLATFDKLLVGETYLVELDLQEVAPLFRGLSGRSDSWIALMTYVSITSDEAQECTLGALPGTARRSLQILTSEGKAASARTWSLLGPAPKSVESDANGWIVLDALPAGEWSLELSFGRSFEFSIPSSDESDQSFRVVLGDASLRGTVVGQDGKILPGSIVSLTGPHSDFLRTDEQGRFLFERLPRDERFEIYATLQGRGEARTQVTTHARGEPIEIELRLVVEAESQSSGSVSGR